MLPKVSAIITYYNEPADYLSRALSSILSQDYGNIEPIVVDDCSRIPFCGVEKHPDFRDKPVIWHRQTVNKGLAAARNAGMRVATGSLFCFLDADDWWEPSKVSRQVALFRESPDRVGLFYTATVHHFPNGRTEFHDAPHSGDVSGELALRQAINGPSTVMIPKEVFTKVGVFNENFRVCEDLEMWLRISLEYEVRAVNQPLVHLLKREGSLSSDSLRIALQGWEILRIHRKTLTERGLWNRAVSTYEGRLAKVYLLDRKPMLALSHILSSIAYDPLHSIRLTAKKILWEKLEPRPKHNPIH